MKLNKFKMILQSNIAVTCKSNLNKETRPISPGTPKHPEVWRGCTTEQLEGFKAWVKGVFGEYD